MLNKQGYRLYRKKAYAQAARKFSSAIDANPRYAVAHYNLACTLALLRLEGKTCEHEAYVDTIIDHLEKAVALDPSRKKRMQKDPDLGETRNTLAFHVLLAGKSVHTKTGRVKLLSSFLWTDSPGTDMLSQLEFETNGTFSLRRLKVEYGEFETVVGTKEVSRSKGTYRVVRDKVHLTFGAKHKGPRRFVGTFDTTEIAFPDELGTFTVREEHADDCST